MTTQAVGRALARVQEIQNRVGGSPAAGQFQAALAAQLKPTDSDTTSSLQTVSQPIARSITIGELIGVAPSMQPHTFNTSRAMGRSELTSYLDATGLSRRNGRLSVTELASASGGWEGRSGSLLPPAAGAWEAMRSAALADGIDLRFVDTYRSWDAQNAARQRYLAGDKQEAVLPAGTSRHGLGLAVDLTNGGLIGPPDRDWQWMQSNAAAYGWYPISNESWHWEYRGSGA